ncbi:MAG: adenylate/guanylate cyclase domain-containing protein [Candidatus Sedimenticola sp. (ex Thyasira tokunagai)]
MSHSDDSRVEHYLEVMESRSRVFRLMYDTVIEVESADEQQIYDIICKNLRSICGAKHSAIASYDAASKTLSLRSTHSEAGARGDAGEKSLSLSQELETLFTSQYLIQCEDSDQLTQVSTLFSDALSSCTDEKYAAFSCVQGGELLAIGALQIETDQRLRMKDLIESYLKLAGMIIQRSNALKTLERQAVQLEEWNLELKIRVDKQLAELERMGRLKRFLSPQLAELIISSDNESVLDSHRRNITVVFCDLRGFTAFSETAEPEDVIQVLRDYHELVGPLVFQHDGTVDSFIGDGIMVFFNDPVPCTEPSRRAVEMAIEMRDRVKSLSAKWEKLGFHLGFGVGIAEGYATLGIVGFEGRIEYSAIGSVPNLAARLCDEARDRQILISRRGAASLEGVLEVKPIGVLNLKGFHEPVPAFDVP